MRISHFELRVLELPYKEPVRWRSVAEASGRYVLLRICTDEGAFGIAEVTDKPAWTGSTPERTAQLLREIYEPLLIGVDPLTPGPVWQTLYRLGTRPKTRRPRNHRGRVPRRSLSEEVRPLSTSRTGGL